MREHSDTVATAAAMLLVPLALLFFPSSYHLTYAKYTLLQTSCLVLFLILLRRRLQGARGAALGRVEAALAVWAAACFVSTLWARSPRAGLYFSMSAAFYVAWAVMIGMALDGARKRRTLVWGILAAGGIVAAVGFVMYLWGWITQPALRGDATFRLAVPWRGNANFTAALLLTPIAFCSVRAVLGSERRRLWLALTAFFLLALLLTRSASGWIGLGGAAIVGGVMLTDHVEVRLQDRQRGLLAPGRRGHVDHHVADLVRAGG